MIWLQIDAESKICCTYFRAHCLVRPSKRHCPGFRYLEAESRDSMRIGANDNDWLTIESLALGNASETSRLRIDGLENKDKAGSHPLASLCMGRDCCSITPLQAYNAR